MDIEAFQKLSPREAQALLEDFLEDGRANIDIVMAHAEHAGVKCDYTTKSLPSFLRWVFSEMQTVPKESDPFVPEWIRNTEDYQLGLFHFDDRSSNLICFAAYYLGECFVRSFPELTWGVGNTEYAQGNMPVVKGFLYDKELPVMMVINNVMRRVIKHPDRINDLDTVASAWEKNLP